MSSTKHIVNMLHFMCLMKNGRDACVATETLIAQTRVNIGNGINRTLQIV